MGDTVITEHLSTPPTRHDQCDRCPAAARLLASLPSGELLFCGHHAQLHYDSLLAAGAALSFTTLVH